MLTRWSSRTIALFRNVLVAVPNFPRVISFYPSPRWMSTSAVSDKEQSQGKNPVENVSNINQNSLVSIVSDHSDIFEVKADESTQVKSNFIPGRLAIVFTCNVCELRSAKTFSKQAYYNGLVLIRCDSCKKLHLIADNIGWFNEGKNVEEIMSALGETVTKLDANQAMQIKALEPEIFKIIKKGEAQK